MPKINSYKNPNIIKQPSWLKYEAQLKKKNDEIIALKKKNKLIRNELKEENKLLRNALRKVYGKNKIEDLLDKNRLNVKF